MSFYQRHIFFCNNLRADKQICCSQFGAKSMYQYAKDKCRREGLLGEGKIGISESRCLGRCQNGPVALVYPDNIWYHYIDQDDIDQIINQHLIGGRVVVRLLIK